MVLSKSNKINPNILANSIKDLILENISEIEKIEIAGPGFLNLKLTNAGIISIIKDILKITKIMDQKI